MREPEEPDVCSIKIVCFEVIQLWSNILKQLNGLFFLSLMFKMTSTCNIIEAFNVILAVDTIILKGKAFKIFYIKCHSELIFSLSICSTF